MSNVHNIYDYQEKTNIDKSLETDYLNHCLFCLGLKQYDKKRAELSFEEYLEMMPFKYSILNDKKLSKNALTIIKNYVNISDENTDRSLQLFYLTIFRQLNEHMKDLYIYNNILDKSTNLSFAMMNSKELEQNEKILKRYINKIVNNGLIDYDIENIEYFANEAAQKLIENIDKQYQNMPHRTVNYAERMTAQLLLSLGIIDDNTRNKNANYEVKRLMHQSDMCRILFHKNNAVVENPVLYRHYQAVHVFLILVVFNADLMENSLYNRNNHILNLMTSDVKSLSKNKTLIDDLVNGITFITKKFLSSMMDNSAQFTLVDVFNNYMNGNNMKNALLNILTSNADDENNELVKKLLIRATLRLVNLFNGKRIDELAKYYDNNGTIESFDKITKTMIENLR